MQWQGNRFIFMRTTFPVLLSCFIIVTGCAVSTKVNEKEANDPEYVYIHDHDSKIAQAKMRKMRSRYNRSAFGLSILNASASPAYRFDPAFADSHKELPNYFRKIKLINESGFTVYMDVLTDGRIDETSSLSVRKIVLPNNAFINLLTARDDEYTITYSWEEDMSEAKTFQFKPADNKILHIK
jgi:hypothetical protein